MDPVGLAGGLNLYGYVDNNPVRFYDPTGLTPEELGGMGNDSAAYFLLLRQPLLRTRRFETFSSAHRRPQSLPDSYAPRYGFLRSFRLCRARHDECRQRKDPAAVYVTLLAHEVHSGVHRVIERERGAPPEEGAANPARDREGAEGERRAAIEVRHRSPSEDERDRAEDTDRDEPRGRKAEEDGRGERGCGSEDDADSPRSIPERCAYTEEQHEGDGDRRPPPEDNASNEQEERNGVDDLE
jgi:uncharacterized protein RhaS with RHS repeats